jgi:protease YdgD
MLISGAAAAAVFGPDNREALPASHRHLEGSIGILHEPRSRTICTAFCTGDDIIATASHCLFKTSGEEAPRLSGFTFRPASKPAKSAVRIAGAASGAQAQHVISGSTRLSIRPPIEATRDWALVRLAAPVCKGRALPVSQLRVQDLRPLAEAGRIYQVAYHHDLPNWQLAYGAPCWMRRGETSAERATLERDFADTRDLVLHACDTGGASSGSPLLVDGPSGPEVVAINVGTYVRSRVMIQNGDVVHRYKSDVIANTAVGAGAFGAQLAAFAGSEVLTGRDRIRTLQELLAEKGYYRGPRDGTYSSALADAIRRYERAHGLTQTGLASAGILDRLAASRRGWPAEIDDSSIETGSVSGPAPRGRR